MASSEHDFHEDDLLPLSALQHLLFCERQVALIHTERLWQENVLTVEGKHLHRRVERKERVVERRDDIRVTRSMALRSLRLGLIGKADVVEFHRLDCGGIAVDAAAEMWRPMPIEYKRGQPKRNACDKVQLCAQALCLEEMLGTEVPEGAIFYGKTRRRLKVAFDAALRARTEEAARRLHELLFGGTTPRAEYSKKCDKCSLLSLCLPKTTGRPRDVARYLASAFEPEE